MSRSEKFELPGPGKLTQPAAERTVPVSVEGMSNRELLAHVIESATLLAKKEIELAKTELRADLKAEVAMAKGLGVARLCAIWAVSLMLVAFALALGFLLAEWAAALAVAAAVGTTPAVGLTKKLLDRAWNATTYTSRR